MVMISDIFLVKASILVIDVLCVLCINSTNSTHSLLNHLQVKEYLYVF